MEVKYFIKLFNVLKIPFTYFEFDKPTSAPCMVYLDEPCTTLFADCECVYGDNFIRLELYCKPTDRTTYLKIEDILNNNKITYEREKTYLSERKESLYIYVCYL